MSFAELIRIRKPYALPVIIHLFAHILKYKLKAWLGEIYCGGYVSICIKCDDEITKNNFYFNTANNARKCTAVTGCRQYMFYIKCFLGGDDDN